MFENHQWGCGGSLAKNHTNKCRPSRGRGFRLSASIKVRRSFSNADQIYDEKLGSDLGPISAEYRVKPRCKTQSQRKRDYNLAFISPVRDQVTVACFQEVRLYLESVVH